MAQRDDEEIVKSVFRAVTPDNQVLATSEDPEHIKRLANGQEVRYERLNTYQRKDADWQPWSLTKSVVYAQCPFPGVHEQHIFPAEVGGKYVMQVCPGVEEE